MAEKLNYAGEDSTTDQAIAHERLNDELVAQLGDRTSEEIIEDLKDTGKEPPVSLADVITSSRDIRGSELTERWASELRGMTEDAAAAQGRFASFAADLVKDAAETGWRVESGIHRETTEGRLRHQEFQREFNERLAEKGFSYQVSSDRTAPQIAGFKETWEQEPGMDWQVRGRRVNTVLKDGLDISRTLAMQGLKADAAAALDAARYVEYQVSQFYHQVMREGHRDENLMAAAELEPLASSQAGADYIEATLNLFQLTEFEREEGGRALAYNLSDRHIHRLLEQAREAVSYDEDHPMSNAPNAGLINYITTGVETQTDSYGSAEAIAELLGTYIYQNRHDVADKVLDTLRSRIEGLRSL